MSEQQKTAGYKVVPVEPTAEMLEAGHRAAWQSVPSLFDRDDVANVYRAMLAAAPAAPEQDEEIDEMTRQRDKLLAALTEIAELDILKHHHAYAIAKGAIEEIEALKCSNS